MTHARIGRFDVERSLGSGTFASVWLARDEDLDARVAIKLLADNWNLNPDVRRRFVEEARALRQLDDDRIVRVYESGQLGDGRPYMVMEFADRGTLEDRMRLRAHLGQPLSVSEAAGLAIELADCLAAVHDLRIVHRDVKPSNVLFRSVAPERQAADRREGRVVRKERMLLADFGIARRLEAVLSHTAVLGSPQYMSPEQGDAERAGTVDPRSDLYSAAVILYELLAGRLPFAVTSLSDVGNGAGRRQPPPLHEVRHDVPRALSEVVARGLNHDPDRRFAAAGAWRDAIRRSISEGDRRGVPAGHAPDPAGNGEGGPGRTPVLAPAGPLAGGLGLTVAGSPGGPSRQAGVPAAALAPPRPDRTAPQAPGHGARTTPLGHADRTTPVGRPDRTTPLGHADRTTPVGRPDRVPPAVPGPAKRVGVLPDLRAPAVWAVLAALAVVAGVVLPWFGGSLPSARASATSAAVAAALLALAGFRLWRTRRRWVAITFGTLAVMAALTAAGLAIFELFRGIAGGEDRFGSGLPVMFGGGLIGIIAARTALRRLRRPQPWDPALPRGL